MCDVAATACSGNVAGKVNKDTSGNIEDSEWRGGKLGGQRECAYDCMFVCMYVYRCIKLRFY